MVARLVSLMEKGKPAVDHDNRSSRDKAVPKGLALTPVQMRKPRETIG